MNLTIQALQLAYRAGEITPRVLIEQLIKKCGEDDPAIWIHLLEPHELEPYLVNLENSDPAQLPLYGIPFAIKDNIDLSGIVTTAGCPGYGEKAEQSAFVVQRLVEAGAIPLGKTNLDQFATGLVGTRSPYGIPANSFNPYYIPGGSSSGSAVAVAKGLCSFSLGTDTAGSGRVPAGFNNLLGVKPTKGILSTRGVVPACRSLDCVSIFALCADDAAKVLDVAAGYDEKNAFSRKNSQLPVRLQPDDKFTFGVPKEEQLEFFGNTEFQDGFAKGVELLMELGGNAVTIDFAPFLDAAKLLYEGPWVEERTLAVGSFLTENQDKVHPVTKKIICGAKSQTAQELFAASYQLQKYKQQCDTILEGVAFILTPTTGTCYTIKELLENPITLNSNLGYYTNYMNLLDYCSLAVPVSLTSTVPFGVTLVAPPFSDEKLLSFGSKLHRLSGMQMGRTRLRPELFEPENKEVRITLAVCGAHLKGLPLHHQLEDLEARFMEKTATAAKYRMYALEGPIPKPGLIRDEQQGAELEVELYSLTSSNFGHFVSLIPHPLGIGKVELNDGSWVSSFIAESLVTQLGKEITRYGGWRNYLKAR